MSSVLGSGNLTDALPLLDSISLSFNPYPLILQTIVDERASFASPHLLSFAIALIIIHFVLIIQATISLSLKIFRNKDSATWLWRKDYIVDHDLPFFIPNGSLFNYSLQLIGCMCIEYFAIIIYIVCRNPEASSTALHSSALFSLAISFAPGFIGLWLSGWSAIYAVFFSPARRNLKAFNYGWVQHPVVINSFCIGIPILIFLFFAAIGIALAFKHQQIFDFHATLLTELHHFSLLWKPNDPQSHKNNESLLRDFTSIVVEAGKLCRMSELMAIGWAAVSLLIITFYLVTTFTVGKNIKRAMLPFNKNRSVYDNSDSKHFLVDSSDAFALGNQTDGLRHKPEVLRALSNDQKFSKSFRRSYYFLLASSGLIIMVLGFNFASSIVLELKVRVLLIETFWQARIFALVACTSALLSISLFLQNLLLIMN